jgi:hypothetical protein
VCRSAHSNVANYVEPAARHAVASLHFNQTGGTTHPGGSITGGPGRNAAMVILADLGMTLEDALAEPAAAF